MGYIILAIFIASGTYVHFRGKVRLSVQRQITDHSTLMAPINCLLFAFSGVPNQPYQDLEQFPELKVFEDNWEVIRDEAVALNEASEIKVSDKLDDLGFNSFFKKGWKRFYLKWYGSSLTSAKKLCPKTVAILESVPSVKAGMFALLPPGSRLVQHRDPYAGSLRYHMGLITPNSDDCCLYVDGEKYSWRDGKAVMFDETFIHYAENNTDIDRTILFLDVKRPTTFFLIDWINRAFSRVIMGATATKNSDGDKVGLFNKIFAYVYQIRILGKKIKAYNRKLYYVIKYVLFALIIYLIFF